MRLNDWKWWKADRQVSGAQIPIAAVGLHGDWVILARVIADEHLSVMIRPLLLAIAFINGTASASSLCLPVAGNQSELMPSAIKDHQTLRKAIGEPMPQAATMIMLYGKGGHLSTQEYSVILVRSADGVWRGTAVGRSQIWVQDAPYRPIPRAEWVLDKATARQVDDAISHHCPSDRNPAAEPSSRAQPPLGFVSERIDVVMPGHAPLSFYADEGEGKIATLIRPPQ